MKIKDIKSYVICPGAPRKSFLEGGKTKNWILVKVETDEGITGWGEANTQIDRDGCIVQHIVALSRYLVGRNPFHIKHFTQMVYNDFGGKRGAFELFCAMSGIEIALWDILGKTLATPVYNLLGGPCREGIRVYANGWFEGVRSRDELAQRAVDTVKMGFTALKFYPFPGARRLFISKEEEKAAVENVKAVREAVGPEIDILVDVHRRLAPMHAIRAGRMMEKFNPFWYEEPVSPENLDALLEVKRAIRLPIVTGEALYTKAAFREVLEKRAADILNPDAASCGGILELKEIAAMAEPYYVAISPHNYNSPTAGLAATIQVAATIPNFLITEYFVNFTAVGNAILVNPFKVEQGYIKIPVAPGLGFEIREEILKEFPVQEFPPRKFRTCKEEGP